MKEVKKLSLDDIRAEARELRKDVDEYLTHKGIVYSRSEWVTAKEYAKRFNLEGTQVVTNWISRGIIPAENVIVVEDLNGLRLIKAIPYKG